MRLAPLPQTLCPGFVCSFVPAEWLNEVLPNQFRIDQITASLKLHKHNGSEGLLTHQVFDYAENDR